MDRFSWGAVLIALLIEVFVVWGWTLSPQDEGEVSKLIVASVFPLLLVGVTVLFWRLQKA